VVHGRRRSRRAAAATDRLKPAWVSVLCMSAQ